MKIFCVSLFTLLIMAAPVRAAEQWCFGIVLDEEGNGLELNMETWQPIHPYYNYISYRSLVTRPGQFILTKEYLNEYGECEDREDYYTCFPIASEKKLEEYRLLAKDGIYESDAVITDVDRETDEITFVTYDGNEWKSVGIGNLRPNMRVHVVMYDNGTPRSIVDDEIMQIQYGKGVSW